MEHKKDPYKKDLEFIERYYNNNEVNELGLLLEKYFHIIFGVCMKYLKNERDAKDHTQQICLDIIRKFQQEKQEIRYFKSWLYQVTKNHCLMFLRKKKQRTVPLENTYNLTEEVLPNFVFFKEKEKEYDLLEQALSDLKEAQQQCIRLFYYQKKTYKEIVAETDYSLKQVKSFIQNGRRNIKIFMVRKRNE